MKNLTLLIILITSIVKAQTFDFGCNPTALISDYGRPSVRQAATADLPNRCWESVTYNYTELEAISEFNTEGELSILHLKNFIGNGNLYNWYKINFEGKYYVGQSYTVQEWTTFIINNIEDYPPDQAWWIMVVYSNIGNDICELRNLGKGSQTTAWHDSCTDGIKIGDNIHTFDTSPHDSTFSNVISTTGFVYHWEQVGSSSWNTDILQLENGIVIDILPKDDDGDTYNYSEWSPTFEEQFENEITSFSQTRSIMLQVNGCVDNPSPQPAETYTERLVSPTLYNTTTEFSSEINEDIDVNVDEDMNDTLSRSVYHYKINANQGGNGGPYSTITTWVTYGDWTVTSNN